MQVNQMAKINNHVGSIHIKLDTKRIDGNLNEAQRKLNMQIVADCEPYVPFRQGALRNSVRFPQGVDGGEIEYNTPYAHYLYEGEVYGPNIPIKDVQGNITGWISPPEKSPTGRPLQYHTPETTDHWFEEAKKDHVDDWIELVKKTVGEK